LSLWSYPRDGRCQRIAKIQDLLKVLRVGGDELSVVLEGITVRKGQYKETCDRILQRLQKMKTDPIDGLQEYLSQPNLQNKMACERYINQVLRTG
jgi:GGDEF domain-containing protein